MIAHEAMRLAAREPASGRTFVLIHGLAASPRQFLALGESLAAGGANVLLPRLPYHGHADRMTSALAKLRADDLRAFARETLATARALGGELVVCGFSVGGLVAAWLGQHHAVERIVAISPFLGVAWLPNFATAALSRRALARPNRFRWWDPLQRERLAPEHGYPRYATHAVAECVLLADELLEEARSRAPLARRLEIVLNPRELAVDNATARRLAARWSRRRPEAVTLHCLRGLRPSHDIIEPERNPQNRARVYPQLLALLNR
ncbi:MAG: alpha/beta hydrolase [Vulcanimicrobiaceae bacterium]